MLGGVDAVWEAGRVFEADGGELGFWEARVGGEEEAVFGWVEVQDGEGFGGVPGQMGGVMDGEGVGSIPHVDDGVGVEDDVADGFGMALEVEFGGAWSGEGDGGVIVDLFGLEESDDGGSDGTDDEIFGDGSGGLRFIEVEDSAAEGEGSGEGIWVGAGEGGRGDLWDAAAEPEDVALTGEGALEGGTVSAAGVEGEGVSVEMDIAGDLLGFPTELGVGVQFVMGAVAEGLVGVFVVPADGDGGCCEEGVGDESDGGEAEGVGLERGHGRGGC